MNATEKVNEKEAEIKAAEKKWGFIEKQITKRYIEFIIFKMNYQCPVYFFNWIN
jgi:hypothetical protein